MSALAHWLELEGIPGVAIALVREHAERIRPPRALWVPFELGRPLGSPGRPDFQRRVLRAALDLLAETEGPVLRDFPDDAPGDAEDDAALAGWVCPVPLRAPLPTDERGAAPANTAGRLLAELDRLRPWYEMARQRRGRSTVGASRLPIREAARLVGDYLDRGPGPSEVAGVPFALALKLACDDLAAYAMEAATAERDTSRAAAIADWFWGATEAARVLRAVRRKAMADETDPLLRRVGARNIVPASRVEKG